MSYSDAVQRCYPLPLQSAIIWLDLRNKKTSVKPASLKTAPNMSGGRKSTYSKKYSTEERQVICHTKNKLVKARMNSIIIYRFNKRILLCIT